MFMVRLKTLEQVCKTEHNYKSLNKVKTLTLIGPTNQMGGFKEL